MHDHLSIETDKIKGLNILNSTINLLELLETGNQENNIQIFDGDTNNHKSY